MRRRALCLLTPSATTCCVLRIATHYTHGNVCTAYTRDNSSSGGSRCQCHCLCFSVRHASSSSSVANTQTTKATATAAARLSASPSRASSAVAATSDVDDDMADADDDSGSVDALDDDDDDEAAVYALYNDVADDGDDDGVVADRRGNVGGSGVDTDDDGATAAAAAAMTSPLPPRTRAHVDVTRATHVHSDSTRTQSSTLSHTAAAAARRYDVYDVVDNDNIDDDDDDDDDGAMLTHGSDDDMHTTTAAAGLAARRHDSSSSNNNTTTTTTSPAPVSLPSATLQTHYRHVMGALLVYVYNAYDADHLSVAALSPVKQQMLYDARAALPRRLQRVQQRLREQRQRRSQYNSDDNDNDDYVVRAAAAAHGDDTAAVADATTAAAALSHEHDTATAAAAVLFADMFAYLRHEAALQQVLSRRSVRGRVRARMWLHVFAPLRLSPLEQQYVLQKVCHAVEQRALPLVQATRLLRLRWTSVLRSEVCLTHYRFFVHSVLSWLSDALQLRRSSGNSNNNNNNTAAASSSSSSLLPSSCVTLSPREARAVLDNCAATLRSHGSDGAVAALTRCLIARATADVHVIANSNSSSNNSAAAAQQQWQATTTTVAAAQQQQHTPLQPSALITLLWSMHVSRADVPMYVWRNVVQQLVAANNRLRGTVSDIGTRATATTTATAAATAATSSRPHVRNSSDNDNDCTRDELADDDEGDGGAAACAQHGDGNDNAAAQRRALLRARSASVGHVFSGLTTRQIYRLLAVLRDADLLTNSAVDGHHHTEHEPQQQQLSLSSLQQQLQQQQYKQRRPHVLGDGGNDKDDVGDDDADIVTVDAMHTAAAAADVSSSSSSSRCLPTSTMIALHTLADEALKNIVFETEAAGFVAAATARLSRRGVVRRVQRVADLTPHALLDLLTLAAQLRVPFNVSAQRVAELLLTPMVAMLHAERALTFLQATRRTHCATASLLCVFARTLQRRGRHAPYALPLAKALMRTVLQQQPQLLVHDGRDTTATATTAATAATAMVRGQPWQEYEYDKATTATTLPPRQQHNVATNTATTTATNNNNSSNSYSSSNNSSDSSDDVMRGFVEYFMLLCDDNVCRVHAAELIVLCELLYTLARRVAPDTVTGQRLRDTVDACCGQMERLLQLGVVHVGAASRLLEYTVVLGMRTQLSRYVGVARLLRTRAVAVAHVAALREQRDKAHDEEGGGDDGNGIDSATATAASRTTTSGQDNTAAAATHTDASSGNVAQTASVARASHDEADNTAHDDSHTSAATTTTTAPLSRHVQRARGDGAQPPAPSRAALNVYAELLYMYERMTVMQASVRHADRRRFSQTFGRVGLYAVLQGAALLRDGHLHTQTTTTRANTMMTSVQHNSNSNSDEYSGEAVQQHNNNDSGTAAAVAASAATTTSSPPPPLPLWVERRVATVVLTRLTRAAITAQTRDEAVLRVLGHVHCDVHKVRQVLHMLEHSPLQMLRRRRALLLYVQELCRRFAGPAEQAYVAQLLQHALY